MEKVLSAPLARTADEFLLALSDSRLFSVEQMESLKAVKPREAGDGPAWVAELVERGLLTEFQAEQLLAGESGSLLLGQYRLLDRLGSGGMGHVYKAEHTVMKRVVALKVVAGHLVRDAGAAARFHHEVELAARLSHPNIITCYDAAEANGLHFLVMEYVEGIDLSLRVKQTGPLPVIEACEYVRQAALGLQHAHEHGLVHCDIKPANLLVRNKAKSSECPLAPPLVKILDFGLARLAGSPSASMPIVNPSGEDVSFAGTPDYIAPEQARDCQAADIRSDLYSLGCSFYYLLTGQAPFPGGTWSEKLLRHQFDLVSPVDELRPDVPEEVAAIVHRLLAKSPDDRYQVPSQLADALGAWLSSQSDYQAKVALGPSSASAGTNPAGDGLTMPTPDLEDASLVQAGMQVRGDHGNMSASTGAKRKGGGRSLYWWPVAILLGLGIAAIARQPFKATARPRLAWAAEATSHYICLESMPEKRFPCLDAAVATARDGDTVTILGDGPFTVPPMNLQGKALTIKAGEGFHPRLQIAAANSESTWQPMFLADRPLRLDGLELCWERMARSGRTAVPSYLVYCNGGSLQMTHCRLLATDGSAPIVCRHVKRLELSDCLLEARASAVCLEVDREALAEIALIDTRVTVNDIRGAAISLWTALAACPASARLRLERDRIEAGRVLAVAGPVEHLQIRSEGSEFTFHQGLLSCTGLIDPDCWRHESPWQGRGNRYRGAGDWLLVDGKAVDVTVLPAWRESLLLSSVGPAKPELVSPFKNALHEPAN